MSSYPKAAGNVLRGQAWHSSGHFSLSPVCFYLLHLLSFRLRTGVLRWWREYRVWEVAEVEDKEVGKGRCKEEFCKRTAFKEQRSVWGAWSVATHDVVHKWAFSLS